MRTVQQILKKKGTEVYSVSPDANVFEALQKMADKDVGALLVIDGWQLAGIFSERDYARNLKLQDKPLKESKVKDFMTQPIATVTPETNIFDCMNLMTNKRVRHLPVMKKNEVVGIISIGDVVNNVIHEQDTIINDLKNYIAGQP